VYQSVAWNGQYWLAVGGDTVSTYSANSSDALNWSITPLDHIFSYVHCIVSNAMPSGVASKAIASNVVNNTQNIYAKNDILKIGDWVLGQNIHGELNIVNTNPKISDKAKIIINQINTDSISADNYYDKSNNLNMIDNNGDIYADSIVSASGYNNYKTNEPQSFSLNKDGVINAFQINANKVINSDKVTVKWSYVSQDINNWNGSRMINF
jgi:hypothetical protein